MGVYSEVEGVPEPYDRQFKLWDEARTYRLGDEVPEVGMASTYAVRLNAPPGEHARFLTVQEGKITNLMAHQPVYGKSVFDKWGGYLGRGGDQLEEPGPSPVETAVSLVEQIVAPKMEELKEATENLAEVAAALGTPEHEHTFRLRHDLEIKLQLPTDLTPAEADRIAAFVKTLPIPDEDE